MIKKTFLVILFSLLFLQTALANNFVEKTIEGYKFRYVKYDTKSTDYVFKIGANLDYNATDLRELMEANNGVSAINGVFFCPESYKECGGKNFTFNERYVEGEKIGTATGTSYRAIFAIDKENHPFLYQTDKINSNKEKDIYYGFANFPLLLQDGISKYQDYVDLGLIDEKMKAKMQRNFICSDVNDKYIYSGYISSIKLEELPGLLIKLGCKNALNLDAGYSSAMIYNGRYIIGPGRDILDGVIIERKGLDTKKIIEITKKVVSKIEKKLNKKTYDEKIKFIDDLSNALTKIRVKIYDKNSIDLYNIETGEKIGYEINVRNLKTLQNIYLINYLNKLLYELKNTYIDENTQKLNEEKQKINNESLLF